MPLRFYEAHTVTAMAKTSQDGTQRSVTPPRAEAHTGVGGGPAKQGSLHPTPPPPTHAVPP